MKKRLAILLMALTLLIGLGVGSQLPGPTLLSEASPNSDLLAYTEALVIPPFDEVALDPEAIEKAWEKALPVGGPEVFDTDGWDAKDMMTFMLFTKVVMDPQTGERVWSHTQAIPALDPKTGTVCYKEFVMLFLSEKEQQPGTIERLLVHEMLRGLFNRRMLVDPSIPPFPGVQQMIIGGQMEEIFGPDWNRHPVPRDEGGPVAPGTNEPPRPIVPRDPALEGHLKA